MLSVFVLGNNRMATRGVSREGRGVSVDIDDDETTPITIDWSGFLEADTIASVVNNATSATVSVESNTTTTATFSVQANSPSLIEHRITTAAGTVKELPIFINGSTVIRGGKYYDC